MSATGGAMPSVVVSRWFRRRRGRALGLMTLGGGSAGIMSIVFAFLIAEVGWRDALLIAGVTQLIIATPLALSIRNTPEEMGLPVDGYDQPKEEAPRVQRAFATDTEGLTSREALRSGVFWRFAIALALGNFATTAMIVHQVPFLTESAGMSGPAAAASVTVMTALSLVGRLGLGSAADFLPKQWVMALALTFVAVSLALFSTVHHAWQLAYVLPFFGLGFGGMIPVRSTLQADYFGLKAFGAIQGLVLTISTFGGFVGPVLAGWLYDVSDSYRLAFLLLAAGPLAAVPLMLSARAPSVAQPGPQLVSRSD
jgi:sugar phosphate permease